jgi:hypothetical protein
LEVGNRGGREVEVNANMVACRVGLLCISTMNRMSSLIPDPCAIEKLTWHQDMRRLEVTMMKSGRSNDC